jgi:hypothetical protein
MKTQAKLAILMLVFTLAMGGRIFPWGEPFISFPNKGMISNIKLFFSLENPLPADGYLRVRFPFTTQIQPSSVYVYAQTASRGQTGTATAPENGADSATFRFIASRQENNAAPFDNYYTFRQDLAANTNYVISFNSITSPTDVGWLGYVQMETLSHAASVVTAGSIEKALIWDSNHAFAPIHILAAPGTATVTQAIDGVFSPNLAGAQYNVKLSLKLSQDFWYWPTIIFTWDHPGFVISQCVSIDNGTNVVPPTAMTSSQYTCTIASNTGGGSITILHNAPILKNYTVIYNITVTNPTSLASTAFDVFVFHRYNLNLTDYALDTVTLSVTDVPNPLTVTLPAVQNVKALLSWGVDVGTLSSQLKGVFQIYTSPANTSMRYQGLKFQFDTATTMGSAAYTITAGICSSNSLCAVLGGSIDHNFGSSATCRAVADSTVYIECKGVSTIK